MLESVSMLLVQVSKQVMLDTSNVGHACVLLYKFLLLFVIFRLLVWFLLQLSQLSLVKLHSQPIALALQ
jgi:hypothetical protein